MSAPDEPEDDGDELQVQFEPEAVEISVEDNLFCDNTELLRAIAGLPDDVPLMISGYEGVYIVYLPGRGGVAMHDLFKEIKAPRRKTAQLRSIKSEKTEDKPCT
jgi:hypothetical protein